MSQSNAGKSAPAPPPAPDPRRQVFLFAAITLFTLWTAFMAYLALTTVNPIVVSQPQIYTSPIVVEALVNAEEGKARTVAVTRVYRGQKLLGIPEGEQHPPELKVVVNHLGDARGWHGEGEYILALQQIKERDGKMTYDLVGTPESPGFPPKGQPERLRPAIYPVTASTRAQTLEALRLSEQGSSP